MKATAISEQTEGSHADLWRPTGGGSHEPCGDRAERLLAVCVVDEPVCSWELDEANTFPDARRGISPTHAKSPCR